MNLDDRPRQPRGDRRLHGHRDDLRAGRRRRGRRARGVRARRSASAASSGRPAPAPTSRAAHRGNLAAIDLTTGQPTSWNPSANNTVQVVAVSGGRVYAGGDFTAVGSAANTARHRLAAFDLIIGTATPWDPGVHNGSVSRSPSRDRRSMWAARSAAPPPSATRRWRGIASPRSTPPATAGNLRTLGPERGQRRLRARRRRADALRRRPFTHLRNAVVRNHLAAVPTDTSVGSGIPMPWNPNVNGTVSRSRTRARSSTPAAPSRR